MRILFVCTANKLRSPTAEDVFRDYPGIEAISAGTDSEAPRPLTKELVASADMIFAMETHHRERIRKKFKAVDAGANPIQTEYAAGYRWRSQTT